GDCEWEKADWDWREESGGPPSPTPTTHTLERALTSKHVHTSIGANTYCGGELWNRLSMMTQWILE
ncbi:hypothetical protein scyTo_0006967, partial [Scyliorhinus torazame]|nr:hypothetical protein [Scyliorhinus torazame]